MKKIVVLLLAMVLVLTFVACGTTEVEVPGVSNAEVVQVEQDKNETEAEEPTEEPTEAEIETPEITFTEQVLVDDDNCTVKITDIKADLLWGYTLKVQLENKTEKELMFSFDKVSVNGYMCDSFWASAVTTGMKSNEDISFAWESFEKNGIENPTDINFVLRVSDYEDWTADALVEQEYTIYPMGEDAYQTYERTDLATDLVLFDNEYAKMIVTGFEQDEIWGYNMNVYLENKTDKELMFSADGVAVNGYMCDPFWAESVVAGKRSNTSLTWYEDMFEENGITDVEEIVLPISVYDNNDWMEDPFVDEIFTVNP